MGVLNLSNYYIHEQTIKNCFSTLTEETIDLHSELFHLLILKYAGINLYNYIDIKEPPVLEKILEGTQKLSYLFISNEYLEEKYNFLNPLNMKSWGTQPKESIQKWTASRLNNNITGGGKQWRNIIVSDPNNSNLIKLKHNYLDYFSNLNNKIPLQSISIWCFKFFPFPFKMKVSQIIHLFKKDFNITNTEENLLFRFEKNFSIQYNNEQADSNIIRSLIGSPKDLPNWVKTNASADINNHNNSFTKKELSHMHMNSNTDINHILHLLDTSHQLILMGPPGTSKSYMANQLTSNFHHTKRVQFHPQYLYQDFILGQNFNNGSLSDKKGDFILFLEKALDSYTQKSNDTFLLIIEEINRANVSQVFGELIQLLDRNESLILSFNGIEKKYFLPSNLKIIGTMNTTDRTVGRIDYAIKRRFYQVYYGVDYSIIIDKVELEDANFSCHDFLKQLNTKLLETLRNREMVIGHAIFLNSKFYDSNLHKFVWSLDEFMNLFYYMILPNVIDYCNNNFDLVYSIIDKELLNDLTTNEFNNMIVSYVNK